MRAAGRRVYCRESAKLHVSDIPLVFFSRIRDHRIYYDPGICFSIRVAKTFRFTLLHYVIIIHRRYKQPDRQRETDRQTDVMLVA